MNRLCLCLLFEYETVKRLNVATDSILFYAKSDSSRIKTPTLPIERLDESWHAFDAPGLRNGMDYPLFGHKPPTGRHWGWSKEKAEAAVKDGTLRANPRTGGPNI
jgi:adenine-specific DNA-methyltransferase